MEFAGLAQDFVEATSLLVGGRTINIMDRQGIIIASTEPERVNTFHQGAAEVIATGKAVIIHREDLPRYPGAREGCNMPIFLDGDLVGVVGIFGEEEEVRGIANLLRVYVTQYFRQQEYTKREKLETELRGRLLKLLIYGDDSQAETMIELSDVISVRISFPMKVFLFKAVRETDSPEHVSCYAELEQLLLWQGILDKRKDVYGIHEDRFLILHGSSKDDEKQNSYTDKIIRFADGYGGCRLYISDVCKTLQEIPRGMKEVNTLSRIFRTPVSDMRDYECQMRYLTNCMLRHGGSYYAAKLYEKLADKQDESHAELLLVTAGVYYQEGGSVTKAAKRLHLHKNTLLYRMNRIGEVLGIAGEQAYIKEFYVRLLLEYHPVELPERTED